MGKKKEFLVNGGMAFGACLLVLVLFELISPFFFTACVLAKNCPRAEYTLATSEFNTTVQLNSAGFRDDDFNRVPPQAIAIIGDSYVFGYGVNQEELFTKVMERKMNVPSASVLNLGIEGTGMAEYLQSLQRYGNRAETVVLVYFTGNDILLQEEKVSSAQRLEKLCSSLQSCTLAHLVYYKLRLKSAGPTGRENPLTRIPPETLQHIDPEYLKQAREWKINPYTIVRALRYNPDLNEVYEENIEAFATIPANKELLYEFVIQAQQNHQRLIVVLMPAYFTTSGRHMNSLAKMGYQVDNAQDLICNQRLHQIIRDFLRQYSVEVVDLQEHFCQEQVQKTSINSLFYLLDGHLTPAGHEFVAEILVDTIARKRTLKTAAQGENLPGWPFPDQFTRFSQPQK